MSQFDMFPSKKPATKLHVAPTQPVTLLEDATTDYAPRTGQNARGAALTVAFASDFTTAGERLTQRVAGKNFLSFNIGDMAWDKIADQIVAFLESVNGNSLNIAGNGVYTLARDGYSQEVANAQVFAVVRRVHAKRPLDFIRSGGQTGVDVAGLVAGIALGIPVLGLWPKGFKQRTVHNRDVNRDPVELEAELHEMAAKLKKPKA